MKRSENVEREKKTSSKSKVSASFKVGAIALAFLVIGYQAALFIRSAAVTRLISHRDRPDTVYVVDENLARRVLGGGSPAVTDPSSSAAADSGGTSRGFSTHGHVGVRREASHSEAAEAVLNSGKRRIETFPFNPNTVSLDDLKRLGFSERQAQSIINYREKGGHFNRPADFAKSYVVADSVFRRLEPFIRIPKVDLNAADSAALDALPGIGPYYAARIIEHREELHGYSYPEQLMDIYRFDRDKYDALQDLVTVGTPEPYPLWTLPEEELKKHPYIGQYAAHGIVLYRENNPPELWTVEALGRAGVLKAEDADRLSRCRIEGPGGSGP